MSSICIVDTSVFCNILDVPNKNQDRDRAIEELQEFIDQDFALLLPMATIYETGNHISKNGDGNIRRRRAELFAQEVIKAFSGEAPWTPTLIEDTEEILSWIIDFPESAMREITFSDLSIIQIFKRQCHLNPQRRIFIWSYDQHLSAYDRTI